MKDSLKSQVQERRSRRLGAAVVLLLTAVAVSIAVATSTAVASSSKAALDVIPPKQCGQNATFKKADADGVLAKLPTSTQALYASYHNEVRASPWSTFAGKKGPWQIGFVSFPVAIPWKVNYLDQLKKDFAAAKAKGLVSGSLRTYIQPSFSSATPEQQSAAIQQMVRDGVDGIILHPLNAVAVTRAIDAAGKAGVPVVLNDAAPGTKYGVNVLQPNQPPGFARFLTVLKSKGWFSGEKRTALDVQGIPGNTLSEAIHSAFVAEASACQGIEVAGTIFGQWNPATTKAEVLKFLASHPGNIDFVMHEGAMAAGIIQAFEQAGRPVPPMPISGTSGGDLSWWLANKSSFESAGYQASARSIEYSTFRILLRILAGKGLKVRDVVNPGFLVTNANIAKYATPGQPVTALGDIGGPPTGWINNQQLNAFFVKPGSPGGI